LIFVVNFKQIVQAIQTLEKQLEECEKELNDFAVKYKLVVRKNDENPNPPTETSKESKQKTSTTGVLA
jgi:hypothetical protein